MQRGLLSSAAETARECACPKAGGELVAASWSLQGVQAPRNQTASADSREPQGSQDQVRWTVGASDPQARRATEPGRMIIYEHTSVISRLVQWKGTVLADTLYHVIVGNAITIAVLLFTMQVDGVVVWAGRPDWVPAAAVVEEVSPLAWQLLMLPLGFLLGLRSNQAYGARNL